MKNLIPGLFLTLAMAVTMVGCGPAAEGGAPAGSTSSGGTSSGGGGLTGEIAIDGSSTVTPILQGVAEEFMAKEKGVDVAVGTSGTGGGFKKFFSKDDDLDIAMASRPISEKELALAKESGVEFIEVPIAMDGLTVVINPKNTFAKTLTVAELKKIWEEGSTVKTWNQVRADFPNKPINLFGAGTESGTFDYFTLAINGKEKSSRSDYQASEDDNVLVQGVSGDEFALGYFGFAYFEENKDKLSAVAVDGGKGAVEPSEATILDGTYQPLSRPLFVYVKKSALESKPAVKALLQFLLTDGGALISETGYVPLPKESNDVAWSYVEGMKTGTRFHGAEVGISVAEILKREAK